MQSHYPELGSFLVRGEPKSSNNEDSKSSSATPKPLRRSCEENEEKHYRCDKVNINNQLSKTITTGLYAYTGTILVSRTGR